MQMTIQKHSRELMNAEQATVEIENKLFVSEHHLDELRQKIKELEM